MADSRLDADRELVRFLAKHGFIGPAYRKFEEEIVRYGIAVIGAWMRQRLIFDKCCNIGIMLPRPDTWSEEDRYELTLETVGRAAVKLHSDLVDKIWDPDKGASLNSYFIRGCLYEFAGIYRAWHRLEAQRRNESSILVEHEDLIDNMPGPEEMAITQAELGRGMRNIRGKKVRIALVLAAYGYTYSEIAHILGEGATERSVEGMLYRQRNQR